MQAALRARETRRNRAGPDATLPVESPSGTAAERTEIPADQVRPSWSIGLVNSLPSRIGLLGIVTLAGCGPGGPGTPVAISVDDVPPAGPGSGAVVVSEAPHLYGQDSFVLNGAAIAGDALSLNLSYAGGCARHEFTLVVSESFRESDPVQLPLSLAHDANGDSCEAWLTQDYEFDLSPLRDRYRQAYGDGPGRIVLLLEGAPGGTLLYVFS